jgi:hypothetical protein
MTRGGKNEWLAVTLGLALSLMVSIVLLYTTRVTVAESLIIGLVGSALSLLIEIIIRLQTVVAETGLADQAGPYAGQLRRLAAASGEVARQFSGGAAAAELNRRFDAMNRDIEELQLGRIRSEGNDYRYLVQAVRDCGHQVLGMTYLRGAAAEPQWWDSEIGQRYWQANLEALARGVKIQRIFIFDDLTDEVKTILKTQLEAGVNVQIVNKAAIDPAYHLNLAVIDEKVAWQAFSNAQGYQYENVLILATGDIAHLRRIFAVCEGSSATYA